MMSFSVEQLIEGKKLVLSFAGRLDESARLPVINVSQWDEVILDLKQLELLNSFGIRAWSIWLKEFSEAKVTVRNCPQIFVRQMNILKGMVPAAATIESFFLPLYCGHCSKTDEVCLKANVHFVQGNKDTPMRIMLPQIKCSTCGGKMEHDVLEREYFGFLGAGSL